jgi:phosphoribulokinase
MSTPDFRHLISASPYLFTIGVAGDSGSGKTTFTRAIREILGPALVSTITLDDYHLYDREERKRRGVTPLDPAANALPRLEEDIAALRRGEQIRKMRYAHATGEITGPEPFAARKILILEGLHPFATPRLRSLLDFTLFVDPDEEVKLRWKMARDTGDRGYREEEVMAEREARRRDYERYVLPQCRYADAVVRVSRSCLANDLGSLQDIYRVTLCQDRVPERGEKASLDIDLHSLLSLADRDFLLEFRQVTLDSRRLGALTFDGEMMYPMVRRLEQAVEHQTNVHPIRIFEGREAVNAGEVVQLLIAWRIIAKRMAMEQ